MAREQGDELGEVTVYTHPDIEGEQAAHTPTDVVNLEARGWRPKGKNNGSRKAPAGGNAAVDTA